MVAKKDTHAPKHPELDVPNLHVIKALTSLKSRGYVKEQFAWSHFYWYLTNEGIQYLRDYLHLPPEIVPATLKRQARTDARSRPSQPPSSGGFGGDKMDSDRSAYRRAPGAANGADKAGAAGPGSAPMEFVSDILLTSFKTHSVLQLEISTTFTGLITRPLTFRNQVTQFVVFVFCKMS